MAHEKINNCESRGIHAERDAINKLKFNHNLKRLRTVNLLVVRFSLLNELRNSKPCVNCVNAMKRLPIKKGYRIRYVYYSDDKGNIVRERLTSFESGKICKRNNNYYYN